MKWLTCKYWDMLATMITVIINLLSPCSFVIIIIFFWVLETGSFLNRWTIHGDKIRNSQSFIFIIIFRASISFSTGSNPFSRCLGLKKSPALRSSLIDSVIYWNLIHYLLWYLSFTMKLKVCREIGQCFTRIANWQRNTAVQESEIACRKKCYSIGDGVKARTPSWRLWYVAHFSKEKEYVK